MTTQTNNSNHKVTGIILSGGAGTRFGGLDKGLQLYKNKALIEHVIERVSTQVDDLIICVNRNQKEYEKYGYDLINDRPNLNQENIDYQGPLAGITSAINFLRESKLQTEQSILISSCDSPELPIDYVSKLYSKIMNGEASSVVVNDGNRTQNLHCLIHSSAWSSLIDFYQSGGRAMYQWHKKNGSIEVDFSDQAACFLNINSNDMLN